ncbi:MAG: metalloregulator ArsR/SmtB family transcription factor [Kofleriaceae bacterium]
MSAAPVDPLLAAAPVFAALGDPQRMALVARLCRLGPSSITCLAEGSGISRQAVTKHLRVLERAGLARSQRSGRDAVWALEEAHLARARAHLEAISRQWDAAIARLRAFVEG